MKVFVDLLKGSICLVFFIHFASLLRKEEGIDENFLSRFDQKSGLEKIFVCVCVRSKNSNI